MQTTLARKTDPATSKQAAQNAANFSLTHAQRVHVALCGVGPRTAKELARLTGLTVVQIDRRAHELVADGLVKVVGARDGFRILEAVQ